MSISELPFTNEKLNIQGIRAMLVLAKYSLMAMFRNKSTVFFGFMFPFMFILVFGLIGGAGATFQIGVWSDSLKEGPVYEALESIEAVELITDQSDEDLAAR